MSKQKEKSTRLSEFEATLDEGIDISDYYYKNIKKADKKIIEQEEELTKLKTQLDNNEKIIAGLKDDKLKHNQNIRRISELQTENEDLKNQLNVEILNKNSGYEELNKLKQQYVELQDKHNSEKSKSENLESNFKEFVIKKFLSGKEKYRKKELSYLLDLIEDLKEENSKSNSFVQGTSSKGGGVDSPISSPSLDSSGYPVNPFSEEYIKQEICVCGNDKSYGSKGCEDCRVIAERYRKRHGISMEDGWKMVWKESGINMEGEPKND